MMHFYDLRYGYTSITNVNDINELRVLIYIHINLYLFDSVVHCAIDFAFMLIEFKKIGFKNVKLYLDRNPIISNLNKYDV